MTKEQERDELHLTILCESIDGWDFKSYVLDMLIYRLISENLIVYLNKEEQRIGHFSGFGRR